MNIYLNIYFVVKIYPSFKDEKHILVLYYMKFIFLFGGVISIIIFISLYTYRESFTTQTSSGNYPSKLLLTDWYPLHKPSPNVSELTSQDQYINNPIFPSHSTNINNLRQWRKPNNGMCSRSEMCGDVYDDRDVNLPIPAKILGFDNNKIRVNFYNQ